MESQFKFLYKKQPFKTLFVSYILLKTTIKLPIWVIFAILPSWRPRRSWSFVKTVAAKLIDTMLVVEGNVGPISPPDPVKEMRKELVQRKKGKIRYEAVKPATEDLIIGDVKEFAQRNGVQAEEVHAYWYPAYTEPAALRGKVFYYLHGGGYIRGTASATDPGTAGYISTLRKISPESTVFALEYRLSATTPYISGSRNPFPSHLIDAIGGYSHLLHEKGFSSSQIVITGDSAGGAIALSLITYLLRYRGQLGTLPVPAGLLLHSPAADWSDSHDGATKSTTTNIPTDYIATFFEGDYVKRAILGNLPLSELDSNIYLSPGGLRISQDTIRELWKGSPPICIVYGGVEMLVDSIRDLSDRLRKEGNGEHGVEDVEEADAYHDFLFFWWCGPERSRAIKKITDWYKTLL